MGVVMALPAKKIEAEDSMEDRVARLETHTEHILADVQQLRHGMGKLDEKIDKKTDELNQKIGALNDKIDEKSSGLNDKIDTKFGELSDKIDAKFGELQKMLESMKLGRVWDRVWMLLAMGTLLGVMARGFKWI
jgi:hypothetical protein